MAGPARLQSVYLMQPVGGASAGMYKIGISSNVEARRKQIEYERGCALEVLMAGSAIDARSAERYLHMLFSKRNIFREWFDLRPYEVEFIRQYIGRLEVELCRTRDYLHWAQEHPGWPPEDDEDAEGTI